MSRVPPATEYERFTDWVIETAKATGVDAGLFWQLEDCDDQREIEDWVLRVSEETDLSTEEIAATLISVNEHTTLPDVDPETTQSPPAESAESQTAEPTEYERAPAFDELVTQADRPESGEPDPTVAAPDGTTPATGEPAAISSDMDEERSDVVTESEYKQFQEKVQEVVQNLIDFLISYDMLDTADPAGETGDIETELRDAARDVDDAAEFFDRLESTLLESSLDDTVIDELTSQLDTADHEQDEAEDVSTLAADLRQSIDELQALQTSIDESESEMASEASQEPAGGHASQGQMNASTRRASRNTRAISRTDDPRVLTRLNRSTDLVGRRMQRNRRTDNQSDTTAQKHTAGRDGPPGATAGGQQSNRGVRDERTSRDMTSQPSMRDTREHAGAGSASAPAGATGAVNSPGRAAAPSSQSQTVRSTIQNMGFYSIDIGWLAAALTYGGLDMFSTALVLGSGGTELNPVFDLLGGSLPGFVVWKTFILFLLFILFYPSTPETPSLGDWAVPGIVTVAGLVLTVSNLLVFTGSGGLI